MPDVTLTVADGLSASRTESPVIVFYYRDGDLYLPLLKVEGVADGGNVAAGEIELPLVHVEGSVDDISFDLQLPTLIVEGTIGDAEGDISLPLLQVEGTALNGTVAEGDLVLPRLEVEWTSGIDFDLTLPLIVAEGTGLTGSVAEGVLKLPALSVEGDADSPLYATGDLTLPVLEVAATISQADIVEGDLTLPVLEVSGNAIEGFLATGDLTLPVLGVVGVAITDSLADGDLTLPLLQVDAYIPEVVVVIEADGTTTSLSGFALALNLENFGLTEYTNYAFDSFAYFNGKTLAAGPDGLYELAGDTDNNVYIESVMRTPMQDGNNPILKRAEDVYVGATADDDLAVSVLVDGNVTHAGTNITARSVNIVTHKSKIGKGAKSRYWAVQIENVNGCDFSVDSIELNLKSVDRKV